MATFQHARPWSETNPTAPQYGPRRTGSSPSMIRIARTFGAPVTEPGGKAAPSSSATPIPARRRPETVATEWITPACASMSRGESTRTVPYRHTRPRSLRIRSTIIVSSAFSFSLASSSAGSVFAGRVPLIGRVTTRPVPRSASRKSSGLSERIARSSEPPDPRDSIQAPKAGAADESSRAASPRGEPANRPDNRCERFTWNTSPAAMSPSASRTAPMNPSRPVAERSGETSASALAGIARAAPSGSSNSGSARVSPTRHHRPSRPSCTIAPGQRHR